MARLIPCKEEAKFHLSDMSILSCLKPTDQPRSITITMVGSKFPLYFDLLILMLKTYLLQPKEAISSIVFGEAAVDDRYLSR